MTNLVSIIENLHQLDVTETQAADLESKGLIYACDDPECGPFYHIDPDATWEDVETALKLI